MTEVKVFDGAYKGLIRDVLTKGFYKKTDLGSTISTFSYNYIIDASQNFPLTTLKNISEREWGFLVNQFLFDLLGRKYDPSLVPSNRVWNIWVNENGDLDDTLHKYLRAYPSARPNATTGQYEVEEIDQIKKIISILRTDPNSRRQIEMLWEPGAMSRAKIPISQYTFAFNVLGGKLNLHSTLRSGDIVNGVNFNIAWLYLLHRVISQETGIGQGLIGHTIIDAHIYCGSERAEFYKQNLGLIREKVKGAITTKDYLNTKKWIEDSTHGSEDGYDFVPEALEILAREPRIEQPRLEVVKKSLEELTFEDFELTGYQFAV